MAKSNTQIAKQDTTDLTALIGGEVSLDTRPDFIPEGDKTGTEGITQEDIRLPRLSIAQGLSSQMIPGDSTHIPGLQLFQMFNDATKQIYGNGPIYFIPVKRDKRCIEFKPRADGGGIVDMSVPWNDKRATEWRKIDGKDMAPAATRFTEYVILILGADGETEPVVLSIKHTNKFNRRTAEEMNRLVLMYASQGAKSVPLYGVIYEVTSRSEKNDNGTFGVPVIKAAGFVPNNVMGQMLFERASQYHESLKDKNIDIERTADDDVVQGEVVDRPTM